MQAIRRSTDEHVLCKGDREGLSEDTHAHGTENKKSSEKSRIPINLDDLIWDLEEHYRRVSRIAKNTQTGDKSFTKTYVILRDIAKALIETMKLRGVRTDEESLAELLSRITNDVKKVEEVVKDANKQYS